MKRLLHFFLLFSLTGCMTVDIPKYIKDEKVSKQDFYSSYDATLSAASSVLEEMGWQITETTDPATFEREKTDEAQPKQILIFSEIHQLPLIVTSRYRRLNVFLKAKDDNSTEVEIRYVSVRTIPFKSFYAYGNDKLAKKIFKKIEEKVSAK